MTNSFPEDLQIHPDQILYKDPIGSSEELWVPSGKKGKIEHWKRYKLSQQDEEAPEQQGVSTVTVRIWECVCDKRGLLQKLMGKKMESKMELMAPIGKNGALLKVETADDNPTNALIVKIDNGENAASLLKRLSSEYDPIETIEDNIHIFKMRFRKREARKDVTIEDKKIGFEIGQPHRMSPSNQTSSTASVIIPVTSDTQIIPLSTPDGVHFTDCISTVLPLREKWGDRLDIPNLPETLPPNNNLSKDQLLDLYTRCNEPIEKECEKMADTFEYAISISNVDKSVRAKFECLQTPEADRLIGAFTEAERRKVAKTILYLPQAPEGVSSFIGMSHSELKLEEEAVSKDKGILAMQRLLIQIHAQLYQLAHILRSNDSHNLLFHELLPYEHVDEVDKHRKVQEFLESDLSTLIPNTKLAFLSEETEERFLADEKFLQLALVYLKRRDFHLLLRRDRFPDINGIHDSEIKSESGEIDRDVDQWKNPAMEYLHDGGKPAVKDVNRAIQCCYDILDSIAVVSASQEKRDQTAFDRVMEFSPHGIPKLIFGHLHQLRQMELNKASNMGLLVTHTVAAAQEQDICHQYPELNLRPCDFDESNNLYNKIVYFYLPFLFRLKHAGRTSYTLNDLFASLRKKGIPDEVSVK